MSLNDFLNWIKELVEELAPALAIMFWDYEKSKDDEIKHQAMDAKVKLELEKNHESVDAKYADKPDIDIIDDAISSSGGQSGSDVKPNSTGSSSTGNTKR